MRMPGSAGTAAVCSPRSCRPQGPVEVVVNPDGNHVYVAAIGDDAVPVIHTITDTVTATIPVGLLPRSIAVSPDATLWLTWRSVLRKARLRHRPPRRGQGDHARLTADRSAQVRIASRWFT